MESFLSSWIVGAAAVQIPLDVAGSYLDMDLEAELLKTRQSVDRILSTDVTFGPDPAALGALRSEVDSRSVTVDAVSDRFNQAIRDMSAASRATLSKIAGLSASLGNPDLQSTGEVVTADAEVSEANWHRMIVAASALFPGAVGSTATPLDVAASNALYQRAMEELRNALTGEEAATLERLELRDAGPAGFAQLVTSILVSEAPTSIDPSTMKAFSAGFALQNGLLEVGDAAHQRLTASADDLETQARRAITAYALAVLATLVPIAVGTGLISRSVVRPLDALAERARAVVSGTYDLDPLEVRGPIEVEISTVALNDAIESLRHLKEAIDAMAEGDLDMAGGWVPAGSLGVAFGAAVDRLSRTLTENEQLRERLASEAVRDPLTGLANRRLLIELLDATLRDARRSTKDVGVLFLDLDGFKSVNDVHGHAAGDVVLRRAAERLTRCVRDADVVARYGGDEFVVVGHDVANLRNRVEEAMSHDYVLDNNSTVRCPASVGFAHATAAIEDAASLLAEADKAMYADKQRRSATR
jgi:diguanylate cyclase (GGDEF)-like protein